MWDDCNIRLMGQGNYILKGCSQLSSEDPEKLAGSSKNNFRGGFQRENTATQANENSYPSYRGY